MDQPVAVPVQIPDMFKEMSEEQLAQVISTLRNPMYGMMIRGMASKLGMSEFLNVITDESIPPERAARFLAILRDCAVEGTTREVMFERFKNDPLIGSKLGESHA
jgi:hypothetical protein